MTIVLAGFGASTAATGASSGAIVGAITGLGLGIIGPLVGTGTASSVAGAAGASASAGAILGYVTSKEVNGAIAGSMSGTLTSALSAKVFENAVGTSNIPIGVARLILGTEIKDLCTFDCWKPIVHDESTTPSKGILLKDIVIDPRIKKVTTIESENSDEFPEIYLENIWNEKYRINYVMLPSNELAAHAIKVE